ncbi:penicillin acylase family protein [Parendozoicomonas haliclonae]|uniref:Penicillin acylase 2 n=1 Tax=Parendozoicomonas haliclonae TaxID=1960125 RepID=A0A1X7ARB2_9GAMM|nr:penicillin acylase family protein [Parendozoicomonas haliclonae]SMA50854.1 Penicillin acylase 2 precursor [Parendozoicomonas haliclonae]
MVIWIRRLLLLFVVLALLGALAIYGILSLSLPKVDGEVVSSKLSGNATVERDAQGIPTIKADSRLDVAFATGYTHAQDRFFQMDLNRRNSAGELAALVGELALEHDKKVRIHRFRDVAATVIEQMPESERALLEAYTAGANQGLNEMGYKPFEYVLLGLEPQPWKPEDTFLTVFSMYLDLTSRQAGMDKAKGFLADIAGREVTEFLSPVSTRWDAPLRDIYFPEPAIPGADQVNLRAFASEQYAALGGVYVPEKFIGSNNFAVSGKLTEHGGAIVEDDMHLGLRVPTIWYRAQFVYQDGGQERRVNGVTLPGTPFVVVGTNGSVAWAFTNSNGDWVDWVNLELTEDGRYMTPEGPKAFDIHKSVIEVKGQEPVVEELRFSIWGPVIESEYDGSLKALRWTAHDPEATNANLYMMEMADTIYEAVNVANISGVPPQNFTVGDSAGRVGWSIMGRIPNRIDLDTTYPLTWQQAVGNWAGWLPVDNYPMVLNPVRERIWTANARVASEENYQKMGNGGYATGPRALQIRDNLLAKEQFTEKDLLEIAADNDAVYIAAWRAVALKAIQNNGSQANDGQKEFARMLDNWSGQALASDAGYRMGREFQDAMKEKVLRQLGRYFLLKADRTDKGIEDIWLQNLSREESSVLRLLEQQPMNWLSPEYDNWNQLILETVDEVVADLGGAETLAQRTWGERNTAKIEHPLAKAIPVVGQWLNMPAVPLNGDGWIPNAQRASSGVSQRMVVSPGREEDGILHIPGGQSGNPTSPFYRSDFDNWLHVRANPLLPGDTVHTLTLKAE